MTLWNSPDSKFTLIFYRSLIFHRSLTNILCLIETLYYYQLIFLFIRYFWWIINRFVTFIIITIIIIIILHLFLMVTELIKLKDLSRSYFILKWNMLLQDSKMIDAILMTNSICLNLCTDRGISIIEDNKETFELFWYFSVFI